MMIESHAKMMEKMKENQDDERNDVWNDENDGG
jgi:hypothetical protein